MGACEGALGALEILLSRGGWPGTAAAIILELAKERICNPPVDPNTPDPDQPYPGEPLPIPPDWPTLETPQGPGDSDFPLDPPPPAPRDPLILDLNGNGIQLTSVSGSHSFFDVDNDGFIEQTAWVAGGDGLLALDKNGNGRIDDSSELFGTGTADGFAVLSQYDSDHNGVIDARDAIFSDLRVWHDSNADGVGELTALADPGIASINLSAKTSNVTIQGNTVLKQGAFTRTDGTTGEISAVALAANQASPVPRI